MEILSSLCLGIVVHGIYGLVERRRNSKMTIPKLIPVEELPPEVLLLVFGCLDCKTLCKVSQVSRQFQRIAEDSLLWKIRIQQNFTPQQIHSHRYGKKASSEKEFYGFLHKAVREESKRKKEEEKKLLEEQRKSELERLATNIGGLTWKYGPKTVLLGGMLGGLALNTLFESINYYGKEKWQGNAIFDVAIGDYHQDKLVLLIEQFLPDSWSPLKGYALRALLMSGGFGVEVLVCWALMRLMDMYIDLNPSVFRRMWFCKDAFVFSAQ